MPRAFWLLLPVLLVLTAAAEARPRDDALSGAIRCGVVTQSRQWLDCYYGAAQPVRAALGLAPALAGQIALAASPPSGGPPQDEAVRDQVVAAAAGCMREVGDRPWLDCYYAAALPMRTRLGLSAPQTANRSVPVPMPQLTSAPAPVRAAPAGPPPMPSTHGLFSGMFSNLKPIVRNMPMEAFVLNDKGAFTVTLIDGEVWQQAPEDEVYHPARWHRPASEMSVTITPDAMHTFELTVAGEGYFYKVHRIH